MNVRQKLGALLLLAVIAVVIAAAFWPDPDGPEPDAADLTVVKGYGGGLKVDFLNDPEVETILKERYGLQVDITGVGSIEIACDVPLTPEDDFVWLGDSVALETHKQCGGLVLSAENVYYSPVVLYSWAPIVDALVAAGVAQLEQDGTYSVDFAQLVQYAEAGRTWADLGLPQLHAQISVQTTDPARSNSGFLFAGLLANAMNGGSVVNATTVTPLLPGIQTFIQRSGYMPGRSSELWELYLVTGMGAKPIVTLYESQIIEHILANPSQLDNINQRVRILYPEPTVWATHPFVARTADGERLLEALLDPDIQRLAAENHGERPSVASVAFSPDVNGIRKDISSVVGMPAPAVMDQILDAIAALPPSAPSAPAASPPAATPEAITTQWNHARARSRRGRRPATSHQWLKTLRTARATSSASSSVHCSSTEIRSRRSRASSKTGQSPGA